MFLDGCSAACFLAKHEQMFLLSLCLMIMFIFIWLVVSNHGILNDFPYIGNVIIPTDELIFFRWVGIPPTSSYSWSGYLWFISWMLNLIPTLFVSANSPQWLTPWLDVYSAYATALPDRVHRCSVGSRARVPGVLYRKDVMYRELQLRCSKSEAIFYHQNH